MMGQYLFEIVTLKRSQQWILLLSRIPLSLECRHKAPSYLVVTPASRTVDYYTTVGYIALKALPVTEVTGCIYKVHLRGLQSINIIPTEVEGASGKLRILRELHPFWDIASEAKQC